MADNELKLPEREMPMTVTNHMWSTFFAQNVGICCLPGCFVHS